jgi:hypothetical protein
MDIKRLADKYGLRVKRGDCGECFVPCKRGQIYKYGSGLLGAMVFGPNASARAWSRVKRALSAAGFTPHQDGDSEGSLLFNGDSEAQCREAIRVMGAFRRRRYSPETLKKLTERISKPRNNAAKARTKMALQPPESIATRLVVAQEGGKR